MIVPFSLKNTLRTYLSVPPADIALESSLTPRESAAIDSYQKNSTQVNNGLCAGAPACDLTRALDSAIAKSTTTSVVRVYRGCTEKRLGTQLRPGATLHDEAFISTSRDVQVAKLFAIRRGQTEHAQNGQLDQDNPSPKAFVIVLDLAKGQAALDVSWENWSWTYNEKEVLLPRRTALEVVDVRQEILVVYPQRASSFFVLDAKVVMPWKYDR